MPWTGRKRVRAPKPRSRSVSRSRSVKRRRQNQQSGMTVSIPRPLSNQTFCTFRYQERITLTPTASNTVAYVVSANGLYDVDITGTGHQPAGFDELMTMYDHYCVMSSKINVMFCNNATTAIGCGVALSDSSTSVIDARRYTESGVSTWALVAPSGGMDMSKQNQSMDLSTFLGRPDILSEDDCAGTASANPVEGAFYHIWVEGYGVTGTATDIVFTIEFFTCLREPKILALS